MLPVSLRLYLTVASMRWEQVCAADIMLAHVLYSANGDDPREASFPARTLDRQR